MTQAPPPLPDPAGAPADEAQAQAAQLIDSIRTALLDGRTPKQIAKDLVKAGMTPQDADLLIAQVARDVEQFKTTPEFRAIKRAKGKKHLIIGSLWCVGGIVVTVATMAAASGGGTYVLFWGAIIFGGIEAIYGLITMLTA